MIFLQFFYFAIERYNLYTPFDASALQIRINNVKNYLTLRLSHGKIF